MKIKSLMDFLNTDSNGVRGEGGKFSEDAKVVDFETARMETASGQVERRELLATGTQWADQSMGDILADQGKLDRDEIARIIEYQREKGLYFGEAAVDLKLIDQEDVLHVLSIQFDYTYDKNEESLSKDMAMAYSPFSQQAEEFRTIRSQLLNNWLTREQMTLAIVSPKNREGRSYVAANLALAFAQLGRPTLLIDGDFRAPRQHEIFHLGHRVGLSMLLAGRIHMEDLDTLPSQLSSFQYLSMLVAGALPPNPVELLSKNTFPLMLKELKRYFDVIIIDTPPATYQADVISIATAAGSALLVNRYGNSKMEDTKHLKSILTQAGIKIVGAVLNQY